jgi:hypothetical protein
VAGYAYGEETGCGLLVRQDGVRLRGKLSEDERERLDAFTASVRGGKITVRSRELARALQSAVNPERPVIFFEKLISRRKLNVELSSVLAAAVTFKDKTTTGQHVAAGREPVAGVERAYADDFGLDDDDDSSDSSTDSSTDSSDEDDDDGSGDDGKDAVMATASSARAGQSAAASSSSGGSPPQQSAAAAAAALGEGPRAWGNPALFAPGIGYGKYTLASPSLVVDVVNPPPRPPYVPVPIELRDPNWRPPTAHGGAQAPGAPAAAVEERTKGEAAAPAGKGRKRGR